MAAVVLISSIALFLSQKNGITRAMAIERLIVAMYVGVVVFVSFVDVVPLPTVRWWVTGVAWNVIHFLWILASAWLFWKTVRDG